MGYVHDTAMSQFIPPAGIGKTAGTWTPAVASNVVSEAKTAADEAFTLLIPIQIPSNGAAMKGAFLQSVEVWYKIATAAADDFATVAMHRMTLPASGTAVSGVAVTLTVDGDHDTAAERLAVGDHKITLTVDSPFWMDDGECVWASLVVDAALGTEFTLYGAVANFTLRI